MQFQGCSHRVAARRILAVWDRSLQIAWIDSTVPNNILYASFFLLLFVIGASKRCIESYVDNSLAHRLLYFWSVLHSCLSIRFRVYDVAPLSVHCYIPHWKVLSVASRIEHTGRFRFPLFKKQLPYAQSFMQYSEFSAFWNLIWLFILSHFKRSFEIFLSKRSFCECLFLSLV